MTSRENERLAVVETEIANLKEVVNEIRADVKVLREALGAGNGVLALLSRIVPWLSLGLVLYISVAR